MSTYINAKLMEVDDDRLVVLNGVKYLVMDDTKIKKVRVAQKTKGTKKPVKKRKPAKPYQDFERTQEAVLAILKVTPGLKSTEILPKLNEGWKLDIPSSALSGLLGRMKTRGLIEINGSKGNATWSLKKEEPQYNTVNPNQPVGFNS